MPQCVAKPNVALANGPHDADYTAYVFDSTQLGAIVWNLTLVAMTVAMGMPSLEFFIDISLTLKMLCSLKLETFQFRLNYIHYQYRTNLTSASHPLSSILDPMKYRSRTQT